MAGKENEISEEDDPLDWRFQGHDLQDEGHDLQDEGHDLQDEGHDLQDEGHDLQDGRLKEHNLLNELTFRRLTYDHVIVDELGRFASHLGIKQSKYDRIYRDHPTSGDRVWRVSS